MKLEMALYYLLKVRGCRDIDHVVVQLVGNYDPWADRQDHPRSGLVQSFFEPLQRRAVQVSGVYRMIKKEPRFRADALIPRVPRFYLLTQPSQIGRWVHPEQRSRAGFKEQVNSETQFSATIRAAEHHHAAFLIGSLHLGQARGRYKGVFDQVRQA